MNNQIYHQGQELICLPGFDRSDDRDSSGGAGYKEGKKIVVDHVTHEDHDGDNRIYWTADSQQGIYGRALKPVDEVVNEYNPF